MDLIVWPSNEANLKQGDRSDESHPVLKPEMTKSSKRSQSKTVINMMGSQELRPMGSCNWGMVQVGVPPSPGGRDPLEFRLQPVRIPAEAGTPTEDPSREPAACVHPRRPSLSRGTTSGPGTGVR